MAVFHRHPASFRISRARGEPRDQPVGSTVTNLWSLILQVLRKKAPPTTTAQPAAPTVLEAVDVDTARKMLVIDFEQAFIVHSDYRSSERDLFSLSLKILSFPILIIGALLSAQMISSVGEIRTVLELPFIYIALIVTGLLNTIVLRAYIVNDKVQTEAKHQVNRLRGLYLQALEPGLPTDWQPVWGSTNPYLSSRRKLKAATMTALGLGALNAGYVSFGLDRLMVASAITWHGFLSATVALLYFLMQQEITWAAAQKIRRRVVQ